MDREQEVEKMVEIAHEYSKDIANTPYYKGTRTDMEAIYDAGYRKVGEVHEPKIETEEWIAPRGWQAKAYCPNCGKELSRSFEFSSKENIAIDKALLYAPNYCPNCGVRLKEVKE